MEDSHQILMNLYNVGMTLLSPLLCLFFYVSAYFKDPEYRSKLLERLAIYPKNFHPVRHSIWVHVSSLGELMAATPLLKRFNEPLLITCFTPAGKRQAQRLFPQAQVVWVPLDVRWNIRRFLRQFNPRLGIIVETEIWPNLIREVVRSKIPLFLVNARLSERSVKRYRQWQAMFVPLFKDFTKIIVQSARDQKRFLFLGVDETKIVLSGNLKFDLQISFAVKKQVERLKKIFIDRTIFIAASTHEKEEALILRSFRELHRRYHHLLLFLVPRHPERFKTVYDLARQSFKTEKFSNLDLKISLSLDTEVLIGDVLGQLLVFYGVSHFALVGGSLVPVGGHNLLEPLFFKLPVLAGPYLQNCQEISQQLLDHQALLIVQNSEDLTRQVSLLIENKQARISLSLQGERVLQKYRGAVETTLQALNL